MTVQLSEQQYPWMGNNNSNSNSNTVDHEFVRELLRQENKLNEQKRLTNAIHNPVTGFIHLEDPSYPMRDGVFPWDYYPKVIDTNRYLELAAKSASGQSRHANDDQTMFNFYTPEWQNEAVRCHDFIKAQGAGVITSTEFPAITVTTVSNELLRNELLVAQKYNLLQITTTQNIDKLQIIYPEYNDTGKKVRSGYKENDPLDTVGPGLFTETRIDLQKSGVGLAFTEEFYMREFRYPIQQFLLEHIAQDFVRVKHDRLVALLPSFTDVATAGTWSAYTAGNLQSTNRPTKDLNVVKTAINADKLAKANTIVSRERVWIDYDINTWTNGFGQPLTASNRDQNDVIVNPKGIPWANRWILNEDILDDKAYIFDNRAFIMVQGPRKTTQVQHYNPDQTAFYQKDWFKQHLRKTAWGREITGLTA